MAILPSEIAFYESTNGLGGAITDTLVPNGDLNGLFDGVTSAESAAGAVEYRAIYVRNENPTITLEEAIAYISTNTPPTNTRIGIGIGTALVGGIEQSIPNETTAPIDVFFTNEVGVDNALSLGNITGSFWKAIWLRRTIDVGSAALDTDGATITVQGDTAA